MQKRLIVIVGPTAVGKTSIAIALAQHLQCEIISCDSRQFYKELEIGTAKPSAEELATVKHHFINSLHIKDDYNAMAFEKEALRKIAELHEKTDDVVMVGGSGLFVKAVCEGFDDIPDVSLDIRETLNQRLQDEGIELLQNELLKRDPKFFNAMDIHNSQRLVRALEVCIGTGKPYSSFRTGKKKSRPFAIQKIGLELDREILNEKIDLRMDMMLETGLLEEVKALEKFKNQNALQTVGYKEIFDFLENKYDWDECLTLLKRNSRRYAKRQMTWFKKDEEVTWCKPDFKAVLNLLS